MGMNYVNWRGLERILHTAYCCPVSISDVIHSYSFISISVVMCTSQLCLEAAINVTWQRLDTAQQCKICLKTVPRKCFLYGPSLAIYLG
jgi:hypothetical protein